MVKKNRLDKKGRVELGKMVQNLKIQIVSRLGLMFRVQHLIQWWRLIFSPVGHNECHKLELWGAWEPMCS